MNQQFKEYTTSSAFCLNLSSNMVQALLHFPHVPSGHPRKYDSYVSTVRHLEERGLVWIVKDAKTGWTADRGLTEEGKLVVKLLERAGFARQRKEKVA